MFFKLISWNDVLSTSREIGLRRKAHDFVDDNFMKWLGDIKQLAITWANTDPDLCHHGHY